MSIHPDVITLDLEIQVVRNRNKGLEVRAFTSYRDRPDGDFRKPFSGKKARRLIQEIQETIDTSIRTGRIAHSFQEQEEAGLVLRERGSQLFDSLFVGKIRQTLEASYEMLKAEGVRLRLRIAFAAENRGLVPFAALPWELLHDPDRQNYLARQDQISVARYLDFPLPIHRLFTKPPLRVLLVAPDPEEPDLPKTTVKEEEQQLYEILQQVTGIEVHRVASPTVAGLLADLREHRPHVLHFMGHGGVNKETGETGLWFEAQDRSPDGILARDLARQLAPFLGSLRLVVLNACQGARERETPRQVPFGSVSSALLHCGLMAVVAMQFTISDGEANRFSDKFYRDLILHGDVDRAMAAARRAIPRDSLEWITPVLTTRAPDGILFDPRAAPVAGEPVRIAIHSFDGWGGQMQAWSHAFLSMTSYFDNRYLRPGKSWQRDLYPKLEGFLRRAVLMQEKIHLSMQSHLSLAFAVGYLLEAKAGLDITLRQLGIGGMDDWDLREPVPPDAGQWEVRPHPIEGREGPDFVFAISPTRSVLTDVVDFVTKRLPQIGEVWEFWPDPVPSQIFVKNGLHALALAEAINRKIYEFAPGRSKATFHIFYAGPTSLLFFLGRLSRGPRKIQLYEFDFDGEGNKTYTPSLRFPAPQSQ